MKERLYNKENAYSDSYQMRSKQYSMANLQKEPPSYSPKGLQDNMNPFDATYQRTQKYLNRQQLDINKVSKYDRSPYGRTNNDQLFDNYDLSEKKSKQKAYQPRQKSNHDTFNEHSFGEVSMQTDSNNKRQNAKRKGLQIKMSNINTINDKINNLLSMVKKDRLDPSFREDQISPKRTQSPNTLQTSQNKNIKNSNKISQGEFNKGHQRVKTYSALQQKASSKKPARQQYFRQVQLNNEEDRYINSYNKKKNYPPSPSPQAQRQQRQQIVTRYKYEMNSNQQLGQMGQMGQMQRKQSKYSPYQQKYSKDNYQETSNDPVNKRNKPTDKVVTPSKYQKKTQVEYSPQKYAQDRLQNNFMPITLVQQERSSSSYGNENRQGMNMIDERLKRIKEKTSQSELQNKKYQQRLQVRQHVGKIYTNEPSHNFQLKVHPVINDKPHTVKIAEKLAYQIELDARIRKARQEFDKVEGEDKWRDLQLKLSKNGVRLTQIQLKELLTLSPNEFTPFDREQTNDSWDLAKGFCEAQKHWQKEVSGCATMKCLKNEGFNIDELDLNKKGYLTIEDLVCFVNLYTGHFHKNRDLAIVYRRLQLLQRNKNQLGIDFPTFYRAFTI